jgi:hypothetical protein
LSTWPPNWTPAILSMSLYRGARKISSISTR